MITAIHPKLPMRSKAATKDFYLHQLGFQELGSSSYPDYLMIQKDGLEIHFFLFEELVPEDNYGQVYIRTDDIDKLYHSLTDKPEIIHPAGTLQTKLWGVKEFSLLDPDKNLLTFGQIV